MERYLRFILFFQDVTICAYDGLSEILHEYSTLLRYHPKTVDRGLSREKPREKRAWMGFLSIAAVQQRCQLASTRPL